MYLPNHFSILKILVNSYLHPIFSKNNLMIGMVNTRHLLLIGTKDVKNVVNLRKLDEKLQLVRANGEN